MHRPALIAEQALVLKPEGLTADLLDLIAWLQQSGPGLTSVLAGPS